MPSFCEDSILRLNEMTKRDKARGHDADRSGHTHRCEILLGLGRYGLHNAIREARAGQHGVEHRRHAEIQTATLI
jgi:hypothetical protein